MSLKDKHSEIPEYQVWDLKNSISEFIVPRLELFIKKVENDEFISIPNWVEGDDNSAKILSEIEIKNKWIEILKRMIIPFEFNVYPEKYSDLTYDEIALNNKNGLILFSKYFQHLWD